MSNYYPDGMLPHQYCHVEGCIGKGNCPRCGEIDYTLMGMYGVIAKCAKMWDVTEDEAINRIKWRV